MPFSCSAAADAARTIPLAPSISSPTCIEVDGTIVEFQYKNPHSWVHVRGSERSGLGSEHIYSGEWVSTSQLENEGITKTTLKPGDKVRIWGAPSKNPSDYRMHLKRMERSDGWQWRGRQQNR